MATLAHAQAVKSLNKSTGRRRFVFKSFSQRLEDIEVDVFRSLEKVKLEPSWGSSFFRDCLVEWRELNTAEDFISFYEEMMPFVQTLPLVLLHKESIFSGLLSRLQIKSRLSLEPILRLIAALSRDLLEDFIPFLPRVVDSLVCLLESGADREPEIIEQVFLSWSYILMYLQKYLVQDIVHVLKVTVKLRYYPKDYVQEFMAGVMSFLLRNSPKEQHTKGIRKIMSEVVKKPFDIWKSGVSALLYYIMRGSSSKFHSRAEQVLELLTDYSIFTIGEKFEQGPDTITEVVSTTFSRLCEELEVKELHLMWNCLYRKVDASVKNENMLHLSCLLSLLTSAVRINEGQKDSDYYPMLEVIGSLVRQFIPSSGIVKEGYSSEVIDKVLQLMLCVLDGLISIGDVPAISRCSVEWAPVFALKNSSCLTFIRELLARDTSVLFTFRENILSAINDTIESSEEEVAGLLLSFCERLQQNSLSSSIYESVSVERNSRVCHFLQRHICFWVGVINDICLGNAPSTPICFANLSLLWGVVCCYPHMMDVKANSSSLVELIDAFHRLLTIKTDGIAGVSKSVWQSLLGAALKSHYICGKRTGLEETGKILHLAKTYKSSSQVLSAVAEYLDLVHRSPLEADVGHKIHHPEFEVRKTVDALGIFAENLSNPDKGIRLFTLRILSHYEPLGHELATEEEPPARKVKTVVADDGHGCNVLQLLLMIEETPLSISTSRKIILLISKIQMGLSAGRISENYIPVVLNGIIGIFHNRFSYLWNPASECLAVLIGKHSAVVWEKFVSYFDICLSAFQNNHDKVCEGNDEFSEQSSVLHEHFKSFVHPESDSTPHNSVLSSLLKSLQRIPAVAESRSRQIIPLFLKFLGYNNNDVVSVGLFDSNFCKGKEWKSVLKEWLELLKLMHNSKAFYRSHFLKDVLLMRLMDENDAEIQMKVLDCLLNWKDDFLLPYEQHLRNLISSKNLREELTTWSLSRESNCIEESHRSNLVPVVITLLMPKVRKLKTLASRKLASLHHRRAVLRFIAQLDADEIPFFFALLVKPLHIMSKGADSMLNYFWTSSGISMEDFQSSNILDYFTVENIVSLSWKKRYGFLHVIEEILGVFDESHIRPFLDLLMGCVVRVLGSCTSSLQHAKGAGVPVIADRSCVHLKLHQTDSATLNHELTSAGVKQFKDLRSLCLKFISLSLDKYDHHDFGTEFWDMFFTSVEPLIDNFKQEGSSSEKPSSLFSCFLAMSRSHYLVSLLSRKRNLVADIFSILTVSTASEAITNSVIKFIENLLNLDEEVNDEHSAAKKILLSNLNELISSLHCLFQSGNAMNRRFAKHPEEMHIKIFKLLSKYVKDQELARKFVDILLKFLATRIKDSGICLECLQVVGAIVPILGNERTREILNTISPLLIYVELDIRQSICNLLNTLAKTDTSVLLLAKNICELNATSTMEMGDLDYDTIVKAYEKIDIGFFHTVREDHALVVLSHFVYDMSSEDLILRSSAYRALLSFIEFSALILGEEATSGSGMIQTKVADNEDFWTQECVQHVIKKFLLKHMGNALKAGYSARKEWIELLRDMISKLPEVAGLGSFKILCSEDPEQDFFHNIIHIQKHRRARALARFKNVINKSNLSEDIIIKVFVPFFFKMLLDVQGGKGEHIKFACMEAIASTSAHMEWKSYYALLMRCFREMKMNLDGHKILLRLISSILDQFHFSQICSSDNTLSAGSLKTSCLPVLRKCGSSVLVAPEIQDCFQKNVLPKIQKLLNSGSDKINVNVSVAALKVLKLLPGDIMDSQLPTIIHRIANHLKNRMESIRDEARLALAACLKELGLEYLQFVIGVLRATLKRGYELHVLGYTLHFILSKFLSDPIIGKLDYCLDDLLSVVENDILGDVAEEKEVEKIASKMKETKKKKSYETLKMVAQSIMFKNNALKLLAPVTAHMQMHLTPKLKIKLENMLSHIAAGIECNPSVDQTELFIFIHGLIEDGISEENSEGKDSFGVKPNIKPKPNEKTIPPSRIVATKSVCSHLIIVFSLGLFQNRLKSMRLDKNNEQLLSMFDPFVKLLCGCLSSKYEDVLSASLRCLTPLVRLPLPSLASYADNIKVTLLDIAQSSVNANTPLVQSCLRLLTVLLRSTKITLSSEQLHLLIQFPLFVDLERNPSFIALSLLKAIVSRRVVVPEIYDLAVRVAELMVTSQVEPIRKKCSQILLQFLLHYHLSAKYLQQHLDFLLKNLSYEYSSGREAVLEMLHVIIVKFNKKEDFLNKHAQTLFIHLVQCLANDNDNKVRLMTGAVIKLLIGQLSPHLLDSIFDFSLSWYMNEKQQLQSLGAQAMGLVVEVMNKSFKKHINTVLPISRNILQSAVDGIADRSSLDLSSQVVPRWKEAYYSLVMLEKILHQFNDLSFERDLEVIWGSISDLLLHPHTWLRNISSRLVAFYFDSATKSGKEKNHEGILGSLFLTRPSMLFKIAASLYRQLKAPADDDTAANNLMIQNIAFVICAIHSLMGRTEYGNPYKLWSAIEQHEQASFLEAFHLLDSKKERDVFLQSISGAHDQNDGDQSENLQYLLVSILLNRMGKLALQMDALQMNIVFTCFGKISSQMTQDDCQHYAFAMLLPLYKVCEGFAGKVIPDDVKQVAQEACDTIRNTLGIQNFVQVYNEIRSTVKGRRDKRKREEKQLAVVNPMRNAKRKLRVAAKHSAHKKRKMMTMKMSRWMHR